MITPWWDHGDLLQLWEQNVAQLSDARIIFIDNGSQAPTRDALKSFCERHGVTLIRNETNRGFSAANSSPIVRGRAPMRRCSSARSHASIISLS